MDQGAKQELQQQLDQMTMVLPQGWAWIVGLFKERIKTYDRIGGDLRPFRKAVENVAALGRGVLGQTVEENAVVTVRNRSGSLLEELVVDLISEIPASRILDISQRLTGWVDSLNQGEALRRQTEERVARESRDAAIRTTGMRMHVIDVVRAAESRGSKLSLSNDGKIIATPAGQVGYDERLWIDMKRDQIVEHLRSRTVGEAV